MKKTLKYVMAAAAALISISGLYAQKPDFYWSVDLSAVFDNREGDTQYADAKTYFQVQAAPEIGISFSEDRHLIAGGAVWTQPIGCEWNGHRISPTLYYRYENEGLRFAMGMFGKDKLFEEMPNYIWNDSVNYAQRNIRGAMVGYRNAKGYVQAFVDWRGMQTESQREAFNIIASGERKYWDGKFVWGGLLMMNHLAKDKSPDHVNQFVVDNFIYNPYIGIDIAKIVKSPLDSCSVRAGALGGLTRDRSDRQWKTPIGIWADVDVRWKFLELQNTFYSGGKLFPYYGTFGAILDQGEPYYAASLYNRTSVYVYFLRRSFVNIKASLDFNIAPSHFNFYQRVMVEFSLSGLI